MENISNKRLVWTTFFSIVVMLFTLFSSPSFAQDKAACKGLKIATGPAGKGFSKLYRDIKTVTEGKVAVCEVNTQGALDNLNVLSTNSADVAMVSIDGLKDMQGGDENVASLLAVMPLNNNYLHVLTSSSGYRVVGEKKFGFMAGDEKLVRIQRFSDLRGLKVALVGSAQLWARKLNNQLGYNMTFVDVDSDAAAFDMARKGQVYAVMTVSGWPNGYINKLKTADGLTLIPYDAPANTPYIVKNLNYRGIGVYNSPTLGVQNILVTRPFRGSKINEVHALKAALTDSLVDLQDGDFEPGWKEIKDVNGAVDWNRLKDNNRK